MVYLPFAALVLATAARVLVPYLRAGLEQVAETGSFADWPVFDWRYLALFLLPLIEFGIAFLTVDGLWAAALSWGFVPAFAMAWAGTDIGREMAGVVSAGYKLARSR